MIWTLAVCLLTRVLEYTRKDKIKVFVLKIFKNKNKMSLYIALFKKKKRFKSKNSLVILNNLTLSSTKFKQFLTDDFAYLC